MGTASERVQSNVTEPIQVFAVDSQGDPLTGLGDVQIRIRRESDGQFYDFNDDTFKAAGHTDIDAVLAEVDATNAPGLYELSGGFDFSAITNKTADDVYQIIPFQSPGTTANLPGPGTLIEGQYVDELDAAVSSRATQAQILADATPFNGADIAAILLDTGTTIPGLIAALNDLSIADVQSAMTAQGYTAARAPNLDNLDAAVSSRATQADILSDATPFPGANIDATITSRASAAALVAHDAAVLAAIAALNDLSIADVQTAMTSQGYTVARAALLDNLDAAISTVVSAIAALNDLSIADVQSALTAQGYTSGRAPNLDNLDTTISSRASSAALALLSNMTIAADLTIAAGSSATEVRTNATQADGFWDPLNNTRQTLVVFNTAGVVARPIISYLNTNGAFTVAALPFTPAASDRAVVVARLSATGAAAGGSDWDELLTAHTTPGTFGEYMQVQLLQRIFTENIKAIEA